MTFTAVLILAVISVCMKACFTTDTAVNNKVEGSDFKIKLWRGWILLWQSVLSTSCLCFFFFPPSIRRNNHGKQENAFQISASGDLFPAISTFLYGSQLSLGCCLHRGNTLWCSLAYLYSPVADTDPS